jgi:hypothetical protein
VLCGLGNIGKAQLAVEFTRRFHSRFSSVFWLEGSGEQPEAQHCSLSSRIPKGQISGANRLYTDGGSTDIDEVVKEVMG